MPESQGDSRRAKAFPASIAQFREPVLELCVVDDNDALLVREGWRDWSYMKNTCVTNSLMQNLSDTWVHSAHPRIARSSPGQTHTLILTLHMFTPIV